MGKKIIYILLLLTPLISEAKKVRFSVNMKGQTISPNGVHVTGDFQDEAGFSGGDWQSGSTKLEKETSDTNIYSTIVDIPAFRKYEYKYVNGDQFYEVEFVPVESRVGYDFNDNRWIYIDSLSNDTTDWGTLMFSGNAPEGKTLVRFKVNMYQESSVNSNGVHVAGDFQNLNYKSHILYTFQAKVYELISYVNPNQTINFKYINGNSASDLETVPAACADNGYRKLTVSKDTVLDAICYATCTVCAGNNGIENTEISAFEIYPVPANDAISVRSNLSSGKYFIYNSLGQKMNEGAFNQSFFSIDTRSIQNGIGYIMITDQAGNSSEARTIVIQH